MTHVKSPTLQPESLFNCDICQNYMPTVQCPKCLNFCGLFNNNIKLENCTRIKCPYDFCGQEFYYYRCPFCRHDFNSNHFDSINIKCPFKKCNKSYSYFKCNNCNKENFKFSDENKMDMDSEEIVCEFCKSNNSVSSSPANNQIIEVKKASIFQGEKYIFDNPEEDPYDRKIIDSLIKTKIYEIMSKKIANEDEGNKEKKVCVICMTNPIEWILAPCGHKCLCTECGKIYKEDLTKKCPICKEKIIGILEKVIDD
jgi:hypothetical protein